MDEIQPHNNSRYGKGHKDIEMPQQYQMSQSIEEAGFRAISVVSDVLTGVITSEHSLHCEGYKRKLSPLKVLFRCLKDFLRFRVMNPLHVAETCRNKILALLILTRIIEVSIPTDYAYNLKQIEFSFGYDSSFDRKCPSDGLYQEL